MTTSGAVQDISVASGTRGRTRLHVGLWVAQGLLAAAFGVAGLTHATRPIAEMAKMAPWTSALPEGMVRFIGVVELAGALGLVLPGLTRVRPALTGWAAAGLAAVMALAMVVHIARGEPQVLPVNLVLGGIAAFIAWGRGMKVRRT
jgi:putative oxidoreductase